MSAELLTYTEAARALNVSVRTVRRLVSKKKLGVVRLTHTAARIKPADLERCKAKFYQAAIV